jgi:glycosyltransferase involved in cell wall biosynthesis
VVSYLTEELVQQGHEVTLFASADSVTSARLEPVCDRALRLNGGRLTDPLAHHIRLVEKVAQMADAFDVVHFHIDYLPFSQIRGQKIPSITTLHGRLDIPDLYPVFREFSEIPLVSISNAQRAPMPWANWVATVHHGIPENLHRLGDGSSGYLAFLGRISPEKGVDRAIEIAKSADLPLRIAAKIDNADKAFYEQHIRSMLEDSRVEFIGEICESDKVDFLGNARALLFPIAWPEPFGLVMIEAMACGTPVIAFPGGSVTEIIEDGVTGFIVDSVEEAAEAARKIHLLDRSACRAAFERRFSAHRMCREYVRAYERVIHNMEQVVQGNGSLLKQFSQERLI